MLSFLRARAVPPPPLSPLREGSWSGHALSLQFDASLAGSIIAIDLDGEFFASTRADADGNATFAFAFSPSGAATASVTPRHDRHGGALTEKPLAISLQEVDALMTLAHERQLRLGVFYEMRYAPAHKPARELIQAGAIGEIIGVRIQTLIDKPLTYWQFGYAARSANPWRGLKAQAGGGVVADSTPEGEYQESVNKAMAASRAIAKAREIPPVPIQESEVTSITE